MIWIIDKDRNNYYRVILHGNNFIIKVICYNYPILEDFRIAESIAISKGYVKV